MATVTFAYDHSRDPMNPDDLAQRIVNQFNLTTWPTVTIDQTQIAITHPQASESQRAAIQAIISAYVLDQDRADAGPGIQGAMLYKARQALTVNATFLALGSLTNAQVLAQVQALTRQIDAIIRIVANQLDSTSGT